MPSKKSQVTIFFIIGLILVIAIASLIILSRYSATKSVRQETIESKETLLDVQAIRNYVTECVSIVSKEGLTLLGKQGGIIYSSQGGTVLDYLSTDQDRFFVDYDRHKVSFNILRPRFSIDKYDAQIPTYPWKTFPYKDASKTEQQFEVRGAFGINTLAPLYKTDERHSFQEQLQSHLEKNIDLCLDFATFNDQGFEFVKGTPQATVTFQDEDAQFRLLYPITVESLVSGEKTQLEEFAITHQVRFAELHAFLFNLIESDISNIQYDIRDSKDGFEVVVIEAVNLEDDVIVIADTQSNLDGVTYQYAFARQNRNPALHYISPEVITVPARDASGNLPVISMQNIYDTIDGFELVAQDPDEDTFTDASFSVSTFPLLNPPFVGTGSFVLGIPEIAIQLRVTDGHKEDYQDITIKKQ